MRHRQLNIMQQNKIRQVYLKPIIPRIARFEHRLQHIEDPLEFRLQDLVDDDKVNLQVDDGWDGDLGVVGAGGVGVGGLAEGFGADDAPGLFDEAAADPELQCFFDEGEMLLVLVSNAMTPRSDETGHQPCSVEQSEMSSA
jgi:hypothetical protein